MAKEKVRSPSNTKEQLQKLIHVYNRAHESLHAAARAYADAERHTLEARLRVYEFSHASRLRVRETVFLYEPGTGGAKGTLRRLATASAMAGPGMYPWDTGPYPPTGHGGSQSEGCQEACNLAMQDPFPPDTYCVCLCHHFVGGGLHVKRQCYTLTGEPVPEPEPEPDPEPDPE